MHSVLVRKRSRYPCACMHVHIPVCAHHGTGMHTRDLYAVPVGACVCVCTMNACVCVYACVGVHALVYLCMCASEYAHMLFLLPEGTLWGARGCGTAAGTPELSSGCGGGAPPPPAHLVLVKHVEDKRGELGGVSEREELLVDLLEARRVQLPAGAVLDETLVPEGQPSEGGSEIPPPPPARGARPQGCGPCPEAHARGPGHRPGQHSPTSASC